MTRASRNVLPRLQNPNTPDPRTDPEAIRARAEHLVETLRDCGGVDEKAAASFLAEVVGPEDEPVSDAVVEFVIDVGQSLDWLHRGHATAMIRMLRRRHEALNGIRCSIERAGD